MRKLLRPPELVDDGWRYISEETAGAQGVIVPFAQFLSDPAAWAGRTVGVRVGPADRIEDLAPHLAGISLVAVEFNSFADGRGFSLARLLRQQHGFQGEIRAVGAGVKRDLLFAMARTGFTTFELAPGQTLDGALASLKTFSLAYQAAVPVKGVEITRFGAARS